jgi:gliding motility-associated-like protein
MKVTVDCGCTIVSDSFFVQKAKVPLEIDVENGKIVNFGESTRIAYTTIASSKVNFLWKSSSSETTLSCMACSEPQVIPYKNALIRVTITDENNCKATDSLRLSVVFGRKIFAPNVFSPNNDGDNDIFYLQGQEATMTQFRIMNRWGNVVFERENIALNDNQNGWNGIFKGEALPQDMYIWVAEVTFLDTYKQVFSGSVLLFR